MTGVVIWRGERHRCCRPVTRPRGPSGQTCRTANAPVTRRDPRGPLLPGRCESGAVNRGNAFELKRAGNKGGIEMPSRTRGAAVPSRGELSAVLFVEKHHRPGGYALLASHEAKVLRCGCLDTHP